MCDIWSRLYNRVYLTDCACVSLTLKSYTPSFTFKCRRKSFDVIYSTVPFMMTSSNGNIFRVTGHFKCAGNSPVPGEFPAQRPVTRSFDVFFDVRLNKRLIKQP